MAPNTFENISVRKGYEKGQSPMLMKWSPKTTVTLERSQGPYGQTTVKFIADNGFDFKMESNIICCWRDNACVEGTRKEIQHKMAKFIGKKSKPNRIDLMNKFGDVVVSFSAPDGKAYESMSSILKSIIGNAKCEVEDTKAERYRKQHLVRGGKRRKIRRKTRKHKTRKTKRKRKTSRIKKGGDLETCMKKCNDAEEERKKEEAKEKAARKKASRIKALQMGFAGAIHAHETRQRARFDPIAGRRAAQKKLEEEATKQDRLFGGGKRRKTKRKKRKRKRKTKRRR